MAIGRILSPTSPIPIGTVATPTWGTIVQDDINAMLDGTVSLKSVTIDGVGGVAASGTAGSINTNDRPQLFDTFAGQSLSTSNWVTPTGTVTIVDDSTVGGNGTVKVDATAGGTHFFETRQLALPGDFLVRGRFRVTGVGASSSIAFGFRGGSDSAAFLIDGSQSTTNWRVLIANASTAANGTPVAISASYMEYEIQRVGSSITFKINGTLLHTATSGTMTSDTLRASAVGAGILYSDWISFATFYGV